MRFARCCTHFSVWMACIFEISKPMHLEIASRQDLIAITPLDIDLLTIHESVHQLYFGHIKAIITRSSICRDHSVSHDLSNSDGNPHAIPCLVNGVITLMDAEIRPEDQRLSCASRFKRQATQVQLHPEPCSSDGQMGCHGKFPTTGSRC